MRYIKIPETYLPISDDIEVGQNVNLRIGVNINEPALYGFNGLVAKIEFLVSDSSISKDVS